MVLGKLSVPGHPTLGKILGQGPRCGWGGFDMLTPVCLFSPPISSEILSQRAIKPQTTNQPYSTK